jgi:hypothetical protein
VADVRFKFSITPPTAPGGYAEIGTERGTLTGLDGDPREAAKARVVLKEMLGRINMRREGEMLFAEYSLKPEALLRVVGLKAAGSSHIEVRICHSSGKNLSSSALAR